MKFTEKQIQESIWKKRDHLTGLIAPLGALTRHTFCSDLSDVRSQHLIWNKLVDRLETLHGKLASLELFGCEVPLEKKSTSTVRADFLGSFPGDTGLAIIELKKSIQTERQSFTELLAYANHLSLLFPGMSREDIVYILIAPMETRIAREAFLHCLLFDHRNIIALVPTLKDENDLDTLVLTPWVPAPDDIALLTEIAFRKDNLSVCKVVWEYCEGWWDPAKSQRPTSDQIKRLNSVSALAAQKMEEAGIHGFVYSSQTWSELSPVLPYTNSLVLVGVNPFSVGASMYAADRNSEEGPTSGQPINITDIIPGLAASDEGQHKNTDYFQDMLSVWDSQLFRIGKSVIDAATLTTDGKSLETDSGFMTWDQYHTAMVEDVLCRNCDIRPTGLIRELYSEVTTLDYKIAGQVGVKNHPIHGDMFHTAVDALVSQSLFRRFVDRMLFAGDGTRDGE